MSANTTDRVRAERPSINYERVDETEAAFTYNEASLNGDSAEGTEVTAGTAGTEGTAETAGTAGVFRLTVEIPVFLLFLATSISGAVINNMLLERTCVHLMDYSETFCSKFENPDEKDPAVQELEGEVQAITTLVLMAKSVVEGLFPAVLSLFLGVWSNTHGRKPLITWPLLGYAFTTIFVTSYSLMSELGPWLYVATALPFSLCGGLSTLFTGAYCYLNDITTEEKRAYRLALLQLGMFFGTVVGSVLSPYTVGAIGTPFLLLLTSCLAVVAYVYATFWIPESVEDTVEGDLCSIFKPSLVKEMLQTCFRRRPNYGRAILFLLVISNGLNTFTLYGLSNVDYLYTREKLSWTLQDYSTYIAVSTVMVGVLVAGVLTILRKFSVSEIVMTMMSYAFCMGEMLAKALATVSTFWLMYVGSSLSLLRGLCSPVIRSLISKRVIAQDVATVFALMSALEAILPAFSPLVYMTLYKYTLLTLPGAVYYMTLIIYAACLFMVCMVQYFMLKDSEQEYASLETTI